MKPNIDAIKLKNTNNKLELLNPSLSSFSIKNPDIYGVKVMERVWKKHKYPYALPILINVSTSYSFWHYQPNS